MEFILECIGELLIEGFFELISNKKIKLIYRKLMLVTITLFYLFIICGLGIVAIKADELLAKIVLISATALLLFFLIKLWINIYKEKPLN